MEVISLIETPIKDIDGRGDGEATSLNLKTIDANSILDAVAPLMPRMCVHLLPDAEEVEGWLECCRDHYDPDEMEETMGLTDLYNANQELAYQYEISYSRRK